MSHDQDCGCEHDHSSHPLRHAAHQRNNLVYQGHGVEFRYPQDWTLTEDPGPDVLSITVQSPETCFWVVTLFDDVEPSDAVDTVLEAYKSEYQDLDVYPSTIPLSVPAIAVEVDFVCLDLVNSASVIAFRAISKTILVVSQGTDDEMESSGPLLEMMTHSLKFVDW